MEKSKKSVKLVSKHVTEKFSGKKNAVFDSQHIEMYPDHKLQLLCSRTTGKEK